MKALARQGGLARQDSPLRKAVKADDELREEARAVLSRAMRGEQVDREQLAAAKSLFSYRPDAPPHHPPAADRSREKPISLTDLLEAAAESAILSQLGLDPDAERDLLEKLRARKRASGIDDAAWHDDPPRRGKEAPLL
jgi:plasmid stability protein